MALTARYDRPVNATLLVRTAHGEEWDATTDDLQRFGLLERDTYVAMRLAVQRALDIDLADHDRDAPDGHEQVWQAVHLALHLVESLSIYDFADLDHPEYRQNLDDLAVLLGVEQAAAGTDR